MSESLEDLAESWLGCSEIDGECDAHPGQAWPCPVRAAFMSEVTELCSEVA